MKIKYLCLGLIILSTWHCGGKQAAIDKVVENGVEVVLNHAQPYRLKGGISDLSLQDLFKIDTENDVIAASGVTDIFRFDVDGDGNVFILVPPKGPGNVVYKFSGDGKFVGSFGRMGQGPNELEYPSDLLVTPQGPIWILESPKNKVHVFDRDGKALEDLNPSKFEDIVPLLNNDYLISQLDIGDGKAKYFSLNLGLFDSNFKLIKELDRFGKAPNNQIYKNIPEKYVDGIRWIFLGKTSNDRVYIGNSERGYEILVFTLDGGLVRKIRKEYSRVPVSEEYKKKILKSYADFMPDYAEKIFFPDYWHPFKSFFIDEQDRLFVLTHELGANQGEFLFDIFNKDGVFVARRSINVYSDGNGVTFARIKGDRMYLVQEKPSGFKQMAVYRMLWK
jgi:hypothetical protein